MSYYDAPSWSWEEQPHVDPYPFTPTTDNDSLVASIEAAIAYEDDCAQQDDRLLAEQQYRMEADYFEYQLLMRDEAA